MPTDTMNTAEASASVTASRPRSLGLRIVVGLVLLSIMTFGGAWLLHASITPDAEAEAPREVSQN